MSLTEAIILAVVEGLTEFLPISSTGHMILTSYLLGIHEDEFTKLFEVSIQFGAILAVVVLYWRKFLDLTKWQFYLKLIIGVLPVVLIGLLFENTLDKLLESPITVAITMILGGIILLYIDRLFKQTHTLKHEEQITYLKSFIVGCWQVLAMVPGISRSASSIIGGMQQSFTRHLAAEFSFFLAVPTLFAATIYSLFIKDWKSIDSEITTTKGYELILSTEENTRNFIIGNIAAFIVAILAIRFFINYLKLYGFRAFGWYRIIAGIIMLIVIVSGFID